jgi:hypothetical protein
VPLFENPPKDNTQEKSGQVRVEVVNDYRVGSGAVEGNPNVVLGLKSGEVFRLFALDAGQAIALQQSFADEILKLSDGPASR